MTSSSYVKARQSTHFRHASRQLLSTLSTTLNSQVSQVTDSISTSLSTASLDLTSKFEEKREKVIKICAKAKENGRRRLLKLKELPAWRRDNPYIIKGYRFLDCPVALSLSIFQMHNETVNIWTHLLGFLVFCYQGFHLVVHDERFKEAQDSDFWVFLGYFLAVSICLLFSSIFHTLSGHACDKRVSCGASMDYTGISTLISASLATIVWHISYCEPHLQQCYMALILALSAACVVLPWTEWFSAPERRLLRLGLFITHAAAGCLPVLHIAYLKGFNSLISLMLPVCWSFLAYVIGVVFYAFRIPECFGPPGWFDHWGHSHQWWHLWVMAGIWLHQEAIFDFYARRFELGGCFI